jgi:hypothetical protein
MTLVFLSSMVIASDQYEIRLKVDGIVVHYVGNMSFSANKTSLEADELISITWNVEGNPDEVSISGLGVVAKSGTASFVPGNVSSIVLTATANGVSKTKTIPITVQMYSVGEIAFTIDKTGFKSTDEVEVTWSVAGNPVSVNITGLGQVAKSGQAKLTPGLVSNIVLTANDGKTTKTSSIPVNVIGALSLSANKTSYLSSDFITFTWNVEGDPTSVSLTGYGTLPSKSGSVTFMPGTAPVITLTAKAGSTTVTSSLNVTVTIPVEYDLVQNVDFSAGTTSQIRDLVTGQTWTPPAGAVAMATDGKLALMTSYIGSNVVLNLNTSGWKVRVDMAPPYGLPSTGIAGGSPYMLVSNTTAQAFGFYRNGKEIGDGYIYQAASSRVGADASSECTVFGAITGGRLQKAITSPVQNMEWVNENGLIKVYVNDSLMCSIVTKADDVLSGSYSAFRADGKYVSNQYKFRTLKVYKPK